MGRVIREGEISGHKHEINTGTLVAVPELSRGRIFDTANQDTFNLPRGDMFLTADHQIKITHPEHDTLPLDKGDYVIRIQREYDEGRDRQVAD